MTVSLKLGDIHVIPQNDLREHGESRHCWCQPRVEQQPKQSAIIVHNSADGRELVERHGLQ